MVSFIPRVQGLLQCSTVCLSSGLNTGVESLPCVKSRSKEKLSQFQRKGEELLLFLDGLVVHVKSYSTRTMRTKFNKVKTYIIFIFQKQMVRK